MSKKLGKKHDSLMELLDQVPTVKEHMNSFEVQMGMKIVKRRIELGLTQSQLVDAIIRNGEKITQATISKVESGEVNVGSHTYNKILEALGGLETLEVEFGEYPRSDKREPILV